MAFFFFLTLLNCKNITDCSALRRPKHSYNLAFYASWGSYEKGSTRKCCTPMTDTERNLWKPRRNVILQFTPLLTCKDNRLGPVLSWSQIPASQAGFLKIIPIGCLWNTHTYILVSHIPRKLALACLADCLGPNQSTFSLVYIYKQGA